MKTFSGRRRFAAVAGVAAIVGLAGGLAFAHEHSSSALAQGPPRVIAQGTFRSLTWNTNGTATLVREPTGDLKLRLSRDFFTKHAPELYVYLATLRGQQRVFWKEVGLLQHSQGGQEYRVGSDATKPGVEVAIFCGECNQISGLAQLQPVSAAS